MANDIDLTKFKGRVFDLWTDYTFSQYSETNWFEELKVLLAEFLTLGLPPIINRMPILSFN